MPQPHIELVVAGTKVFAVALLAPLTQRVGTRPRVAGDPAQALTLVRGPTALAVVEFLGEASLPGIQALVRDGGGMRVVVGLSTAHSAAEGVLRSLGVEVARWDGDVAGVVAAAERAIAGPGAEPAPVGAAAAIPGATAPGADPRPAAPAPPPQARPAAPVQVPQARSAAPARAAPAAAAAPKPVPAPVRPAAPPPSPRPPVAGAAVPRPATPLAAAARTALVPVPAAPPVAAPAAPMAPPLARPEPAVLPPAVPVPVAAAQAVAPPAAGLPGDNESLDVDFDEEVPPAPGDPFVSPVATYYVPPPAAPRALWPSQLADPADADDALYRAIRGLNDPSSPLQAAAEEVAGALSELERSALLGKPLPFDPSSIRAAAVLRLRVAAALAAAPAPGSQVDSEAVQKLLAEIDGLLAQVSALHTAAAPDLQAGLGAVRNALVREAIDFSEAVQRIAQPDAAAPTAPARPVRAPAARVLTVDAPEDADAPGNRRRRATWALFVVVALATGAYHAYRLTRPVVPTPGLAVKGAPAGTIGVDHGKTKVVSLPPGKKLEAKQVEDWKAAEQAKGNRIREVAPGMWVIEPDGAGGRQ